MKNIEFSDVRLTDGFWKDKQELNRRVSMRSVWKRFYDTGRIMSRIITGIRTWQNGSRRALIYLRYRRTRSLRIV